MIHLNPILQKTGVGLARENTTMNGQKMQFFLRGCLWIGIVGLGLTPCGVWASGEKESSGESSTRPPDEKKQSKPQKGWWERSKDWMSQWIPEPVQQGWRKTRKKWNQTVTVYRALRDLFWGDEETRRKAVEIRSQQVRIAGWQHADRMAERQAMQDLQVALWRRACRIGSARSCERWRQRDIANHEPLRLLRDILRRRKQWNALLLVCQELKQREPKVLENQLCIADVMRIQKRWEAALGVYRELVVRFPDTGVVWLDWGKLLLQQKRWQDAQKACLRATERMPKDGQAWHCVGHAYRGTDRKQARAAYEKACQLGQTEACRDILSVLPRSRWSRWWTWSRIRSKIVGRNISSTAVRGTCRMGMGVACRRLARQYLEYAQKLKQYQRHSEALYWLRRASLLAPQQPDIWKTLGLLLMEQKPGTEACLALERSLSLQPEQVDLWLDLGVCYQRSASEGVMKARQAFLKACRPGSSGQGKPEACRKACRLGAKEACYHHE